MNNKQNQYNSKVECLAGWLGGQTKAEVVLLVDRGCKCRGATFQKLLVGGWT